MRWWKINGNSIEQTDWTEVLTPGRRATWETRQPPKAWARGDGVFCWRSGVDQGFVGLARILRIPKVADADGVWRYRLEYLTAPLERHIDLATLRDDPSLAQHADAWLRGIRGVQEIPEPVARALGALVTARNSDVATIISEWFPRRDAVDSLDAANLSSTCVYTVISPESLLRGAREGGELHENTRWVAIQKLWENRENGEDIAVLFADAASIWEVVYWARLDSLRVDDGGTTFRVRDVRWISGHDKTELVMRSSGERIAQGHIRPYVVCETPAWLTRAEGGPVSPRPAGDDATAREFFERIIPHRATRRKVLRRLADSIAVADAAGGQWGLSLLPQNIVRLNVGGTELFVTGEDGWINALVDPKLLPKEYRSWLGAKRYPSADGARLLRIGRVVEGEELRPEVLMYVRDAHLAAARAAHRRGHNFKSSHHPGVLAYLTAELGRALPSPAWASFHQGAVPEDDEWMEGASVEGVRVHRRRERALRDLKVAEVLRHGGRLACEVCGHDFEAAYGEIGEGYVQIHHLAPLALRDGAERTELAELALLCANCHVMAHHRAKDAPRSVVDLRRAMAEARERRRP